MSGIPSIWVAKILVTNPACGITYATVPMYSSAVMGKSVPGMDAGFASPCVLTVNGSSSTMATTLCTITLSFPAGLSKTMMSPTSTSSNGSFPLTTITS